MIEKDPRPHIEPHPHIEPAEPRNAPEMRRAWLATRRFVVAAGAGGATALLMGTPTDVVANPWFTRMTPVRPLDVALLVLTSVTLGLLAATYVRDRSGAGGAHGAAGGTLTALAIGCPICNKAVVALIGTSGALSWFGPIQPLIGALGLGLAVWALVLRLRRRPTCALPA